jgi:hypothetical protein
MEIPSRCLELVGSTIVTRELLHRSCTAISELETTIEFSEETPLVTSWLISTGKAGRSNVVFFLSYRPLFELQFARGRFGQGRLFPADVMNYPTVFPGFAFI